MPCSADDAARAFLDFMTSPQAQADYAAAGFRPVVDGVDVPEVDGANDPTDPFPAPASLFTIDDLFGGWATAAGEFFGDGEDGNPLGVVTRIQQRTGKVGDHIVMMPHIGAVLPLDDWMALAERLEQAGIAFDIPPVVRFEGGSGEQRTMFFFDPSGNPIEIKGFRDFASVYAS